MNGNGNLVYLADLGAAGVVKDSDSTFWCDSAQCPSGVDLKRVSASAIASYALNKLTVPPPLQLVGNTLSLLYDPATLAVVAGRLTVIGGGSGPGPGPGGGGAVDTGGGGAVDSGGGGAVDTGGGGSSTVLSGGAADTGGAGALDTGGAGAVDTGGGATALRRQIIELEARIAALEAK